MMDAGNSGHNRVRLLSLGMCKSPTPLKPASANTMETAAEYEGYLR
jgi:hypothetical protein